MTRVRWSMFCGALALIAFGGCRSTTPPATGDVHAAGRSTMLVQVVHRAARLASGEIDLDAPKEMLDAAVAALGGGKPAAPDWSTFGGAHGRKLVFAAPAAGPAAQAVYERLLLLTGDPDAVLLTDRVEDAAAFHPGTIVLVLAPRWEQGAAVPDAEQTAAAVERAAGRRPALVIGDLTTPAVDGAPWRADDIVASRSVPAVSLAIKFVLGAHATGSIPDAGALATGVGLPLDRIDWRRLVLTAPPGRLKEIYATQRK